MNTQDKLEEQEYIDLYNKGYGLYQFSPELAELILSTESRGEKIEAFKAGADRAKFGKDKAQLPNWLKQDRFKSNSRNIENAKSNKIQLDKD